MGKYNPNRKTEYGVKDHAVLVDAIKAVFVDKTSIRQGSRTSQIPYPSFRRYVQKIKDMNIDVAATNDDVLLDIARDITSYNLTKMVCVNFFK